MLVSQALPGDVVDVRVDRSSTTTIQGRVRATVATGPLRSDHPCPHVDRCTGCPLLRAQESLEVDFKSRKLASWLSQIDPKLIDSVRPLERPSELFHYRHYAKQIVSNREGELLLGSYVTGTHRVEDNARCPVLVPALSELLEEVRQRLAGLPVHGDPGEGLRYVVGRHSRASGEGMVVVVSSASLEPIAERLSDLPAWVSRYTLLNRGAGNRILDGEPVHLGGPRAVEESLAGYRHRIGPTSFFQVNPVAAERLFEVALNAAGSGERVVEGYAGVGVLTLPLEKRFRRVVANELNGEAVESLRRRAPGIDVRQGRAEEVLPALLRKAIDAVVLDPPRKGLGETVAHAVSEARAERVVLLSCNPSSLTRDLPMLLKSYRVAAIHPIDQFPRTAHFETVTVLERR